MNVTAEAKPHSFQVSLSNVYLGIYKQACRFSEIPIGFYHSTKPGGCGLVPQNYLGLLSPLCILLSGALHS